MHKKNSEKVLIFPEESWLNLGYFCYLKTLITEFKSTHKKVKLVPLESVDPDESNGTNFRYQLEKMSH